MKAEPIRWFLESMIDTENQELLTVVALNNNICGAKLTS